VCVRCFLRVVKAVFCVNGSDGFWQQPLNRQPQPLQIMVPQLHSGRGNVQGGASVPPPHPVQPVTTSDRWYRSYAETIAPKKPTEPSLIPTFDWLNWELGKTAHAILSNLTHRQGGHYQIPNLEDPTGNLAKEAKGMIETILQTWEANNTATPALLAPLKPLTNTLGVTNQLGKTKSVASLLWEAAAEGVLKPREVPALLKLGQQAFNTTLPPDEQNAALKHLIKTIGKDSVGLAKFMQIVANDAGARNNMPDAVYQALTVFQEGLDPSWKPEEVKQLMVDEFKRAGFLQAVANRPENVNIKERLLNEGQFEITIKGKPLGVASTAEVYRCSVKVVSSKNRQEVLLTQERLLNSSANHIVKVLKKNLVKPSLWDKMGRTLNKMQGKVPESVAQTQLSRDKKVLTLLFELLCTDERTLNYWLGQVNTLCTSWEQELDLRNGAENGRMLAGVAIQRDANNQPLRKTIDGEGYPIFDVALSNFSSPCMDLQEEAAGVSIKTLLETKEYTRNVVREGVLAYLQQHPNATLNDALQQPQTVVLMGLQQFKVNEQHPYEQTAKLAEQLNQLWEKTPIEKRPAGISSEIALVNRLEVALGEALKTVTVDTLPATATGVQQAVNQALQHQLAVANTKIMKKTIGLVQQYPWLLNDPHLMTNVYESFIQASGMQFTQTSVRSGEPEAMLRLHLDLQAANAFVNYRPDMLEKLKGADAGRTNIQTTEAMEQNRFKALVKRVQQVLFNPKETNKWDQLTNIAFETNINPYRIQYIDTGGVESVDKQQFIEDMKMVMGFCTGNARMLQEYFKGQIKFDKTLTDIEQERLKKAYPQLTALLEQRDVASLATILATELYSPTLLTELTNNPAMRSKLEAELCRDVLVASYPLDAFFNKILEERRAVFNAELPSLLSQHIFEVKGRVDSFSLAWNFVQSELSRRRIGYQFPNFPVLKAKLLQVQTANALLKAAGGDNNELLVKFLGQVIYKAKQFNPEAFADIQHETLTHLFVDNPEMGGKMLALFLPQKVVDWVSRTVQHVNQAKQATPFVLGGMGAITVGLAGLLHVNAQESEARRKRLKQAEDHAFIQAIVMAQARQRFYRAVLGALGGSITVQPSVNSYGG
jgi:hypothetical protein